MDKKTKLDKILAQYNPVLYVYPSLLVSGIYPN